MELYTHCLPALLLPLSAAVFSAVRGFDGEVRWQPGGKDCGGLGATEITMMTLHVAGIPCGIALSMVLEPGCCNTCLVQCQNRYLEAN